jgi:hypothetical protein
VGEIARLTAAAAVGSWRGSRRRGSPVAAASQDWGAYRGDRSPLMERPAVLSVEVVRLPYCRHRLGMAIAGEQVGAGDLCASRGRPDQQDPFRRAICGPGVVTRRDLASNRSLRTQYEEVQQARYMELPFASSGPTTCRNLAGLGELQTLRARHSSRTRRRQSAQPAFEMLRQHSPSRNHPPHADFRGRSPPHRIRQSAHPRRTPPTPWMAVQRPNSLQASTAHRPHR